MGNRPLVPDGVGYGRKETGDLDVDSVSAGSPGEGSPVSFGRGEPYADGMVVITTDKNTSSISDGGNLTDVSEAAKSESGSTFTFQGIDANHTILFGSEVDEVGLGDKVKHYGIQLYLVTGTVEVVPRSFIVEIWDGSQWTPVGVMNVGSPIPYRYANELFLRSSVEEFLHYGIKVDTAWAKKTILTKTLYWSRIRIINDLVSVPVFEWWKVVPSGATAVTSDGILGFMGLAKFRKTIQSAGNVFGESGGVTSGTIPVGAGGVPTEWSHEIKNSILNSDGDAIYFQFTLPLGIDTSYPLDFRITCIPTSTGTAPAICIFSCLPQEIAGVLEADPTGGILPVPRSLANTETVTAKAAQAKTVTNIDVSQTSKMLRIEFDGYDVQNYYEGDEVICRFESDDLNGANLAVFSLEINGVLFSLGERV